jgi:hypothetical protein
MWTGVVYVRDKCGLELSDCVRDKCLRLQNTAMDFPDAQNAGNSRLAEELSASHAAIGLV